MFAVGTNGLNFANFYTFPADDTLTLDGGSPYGGLALSGNMLMEPPLSGGPWVTELFSRWICP